MVSIPKQRIIRLVAFLLVLTLLGGLYLITLPDRDPKWLIIGKTIKLVFPKYYKVFQRSQQDSRLQWFEKVAQNKRIPLHAASGWGYMSEKQYNSMIDHVLQELPIKEGDSVFELGCGVGAVLLRIRNAYGVKVSIGGSDLSPKSIVKAREIFPNEKDNFYALSMTEKNNRLQDNSYDHVISFGALAMYLYKDEMELALREAIRIAKPGGRLCFTHFIEPDGVLKGSILEPMEKSHWKTIAKKHLMENLKVKQMIEQKDRYFVCFSKKSDHV